MKLHVLSDVHLTVAPLDAPATDADVVILAGDVARPADAVAWARGFAKPVLYVPGNHEFYGGSIASTVDRLKALADGTDVRVLDNDEAVIGGVRFLGSTLWTDFLVFGEGGQRDLAIRAAVDYVRDFSRIQVDAGSGAAFTPADAASLFERNACWLRDKSAEAFDGPTVVVTHHAPSRKSIHSRFAGSPLNACFVSDAESLIERSGAALWIHGHTHDSFDYAVGETRVVCNPRGYAKNDVDENARFDPTLVVDV